jgi:hypothetical protein
LVQDWFKGLDDTFFLTDRSTDLFNPGATLLLDEVSLDEFTDHPITEVRFNEEGRGLISFSEGDDLSEGVIAIAIPEGLHIPHEDVTISLGHHNSDRLIEATA